MQLDYQTVFPDFVIISFLNCCPLRKQKNKGHRVTTENYPNKIKAKYTMTRYYVRYDVTIFSSVICPLASASS